MQFKVLELGLLDFKEVYQTQKEIFGKVKYAILPSTLILCRHLPVITLGRLADTKNILSTKNNLPTYRIERGGDVTYHGPGQLVIYPVFNLNYLKKDLHWFLRQLEEVIISFCLDLGIKAQRKAGATGVWFNNYKLASIGITVKNWISYHGLSINIKQDDLSNFALIRPCGMDIKMTSLESIRGRNWEWGVLNKKIIDSFEKIFQPETIIVA